MARDCFDRLTGCREIVDLTWKDRIQLKLDRKIDTRERLILYRNCVQLFQNSNFRVNSFNNKRELFNNGTDVKT